MSVTKKIIRVGGGYSRKCSHCEFSLKEVQRHKEELATLKSILDTLTEKNLELEEKIALMIEEKAIEELNVMSKLEQITNLVEKNTHITLPYNNNHTEKYNS